MRGTFFYLHRALPLTPQLPCLSALFEFDFHSFVLNSWFHHGSLTTLPDHLVSEWRAFFARISLACLPLGRARSIVSGRATRVKSASVKNPLRLSSFPKQKARSRQRIQIWRSCLVIYSRLRRLVELRLWENRNFFLGRKSASSHLSLKFHSCIFSPETWDFLKGKRTRKSSYTLWRVKPNNQYTDHSPV